MRRNGATPSARALFEGAPVDRRDGYIHFSTAEQLAETATKHFAGADDLVLVAVDADALGAALKWEPSRGGALFPHLYGVLVARRGAVGEAVAARRRWPPRHSGRSHVIGLFEALSRPLMRRLDAEDAHGLAILGLRFAPIFPGRADEPNLAVRVFGLNFPNPVGMAAGFDKHGEVPDALLRLGFGFVEIGTVTLLPQPGNPRPRLFRLERDEGVINRLGFNSEGAEAVLRRLAARAGEGGIVGVNVGANKDSTDRIADYVRQIEMFAPVASYFTCNISSPNTPGLRDLQQGSVFDELTARVVETRERVGRQAGPTPVLIKIAPDLTLNELDDVVAIARRRRVDGMIVGNTTVLRPDWLVDRETAAEAGGLSGPAAVQSGHPDAGGDLCARGGRIPADRHRRDRFRRHCAAEDQGRGLPDPALFVAGVSRAFAGRRDQAGARRTRCARAATPASTALVGVDAAAMTAEDWPG